MLAPDTEVQSTIHRAGQVRLRLCTSPCSPYRPYTNVIYSIWNYNQTKQTCANDNVVQLVWKRTTECLIPTWISLQKTIFHSKLLMFLRSPLRKPTAPLTAPQNTVCFLHLLMELRAEMTYSGPHVFVPTAMQRTRGIHPPPELPVSLESTHQPTPLPLLGCLLSSCTCNASHGFCTWRPLA